MSAKAELLAAMRASFGATVKVHEDAENITQHVLIGFKTQADADAAAEKIGQQALKAGKSVTWNDDRGKQFIRVVALWVCGNYVWADNGDRVKCERILVSSDGVRITNEEVLGTSWRNYDNV